MEEKKITSIINPGPFVAYMLRQELSSPLPVDIVTSINLLLSLRERQINSVINRRRWVLQEEFQEVFKRTLFVAANFQKYIIIKILLNWLNLNQREFINDFLHELVATFLQSEASTEITKNYIECLNELFQKIPINTNDARIKSLLNIAVNENPYEVIQLLLNKGFKADRYCDWSDELQNAGVLHILARAKRGDKLEVAELLLKQNIDINAQDKIGNTPLFIAISCDDEVFVKWLLEKGANIHHENKYGITPILYADDSSSSDEIKKLLLKAGANLDLKDNDLKHEYQGYIAELKQKLTAIAEIESNDLDMVEAENVAPSLRLS